MRIAVLGATGGTGRELVQQALKRGHRVTAIARDSTTVASQPRLSAISADVHDPASIAAALIEVDAVVSGLGAAPGQATDVLQAGARAVTVAAPARIVWLGAFGTGTSASAGGILLRMVLRIALHGELRDKAAADRVILDAGGVVLHAGPLTDRAAARSTRVLALSDASRRPFPRAIARASVASAMLDLAETQEHAGQTVTAIESS